MCRKIEVNEATTLISWTRAFWWIYWMKIKLVCWHMFPHPGITILIKHILAILFFARSAAVHLTPLDKKKVTNTPCTKIPKIMIMTAQLLPFFKRQGIKSIIFQARRKKIHNSLCPWQIYRLRFQGQPRIVQCKFMTKHFHTESVEKGKQWANMRKNSKSKIRAGWNVRLII